jgi:predicted ATPase
MRGYLCEARHVLAMRRDGHSEPENLPSWTRCRLPLQGGTGDGQAACFGRRPDAVGPRAERVSVCGPPRTTGRVERILQETLAGQPQVLLMPGDGGIGKTRLLQEVRTGALRRRLQVGYGRGYEDLTLPYLSFVEVLSTLFDRSPQDLERAIGSVAEVIRWLLHRDQVSVRAADSFTSAQNDQDKLRLLFAVSRTIIALAQRCPTILVVDDLHWADRSSIDLFGHLVFTVAEFAMREPVPLLIVGSYRPVEPETHLGRLIARLQREFIYRSFPLSGLNESEIHDLVQGR